MSKNACFICVVGCVEIVLKIFSKPLTTQDFLRNPNLTTLPQRCFETVVRFVFSVVVGCVVSCVVSGLVGFKLKRRGDE